MALYDFTLTPGGVQQIDVVGDSVIVKSSTGTVEVRTDNGNFESLMAGQGWADFPFRRLYVRDLSGGANKGLISVYRSHQGDKNPDDPSFKPRLIDNRVTGDVSVIDGGKSRTIANQAFFGAAGQSGVASQKAYVQVFNPAASGKRVVIKAFTVSSTGVLVGGVGTAVAAFATGPFPGRAKLIGGTGSAAEIRSTNSVADPVTITPMLNVNAAASVPVTRLLQEPIVLLPGFGMTFLNQTIAADLAADFEFTEELLS